MGLRAGDTLVAERPRHPSLPRRPDPGRAQRLHQLLTPGFRGGGPPVRGTAHAGRAHQLRLVPGAGLGLLRLRGTQWRPPDHGCPTPQPEPAPRHASLCDPLSPGVTGWWGEGSLGHPSHCWSPGWEGPQGWPVGEVLISTPSGREKGRWLAGTSSHELLMVQSGRGVSGFCVSWRCSCSGGCSPLQPREPRQSSSVLGAS